MLTSSDVFVSRDGEPWVSVPSDLRSCAVRFLRASAPHFERHVARCYVSFACPALPCRRCIRSSRRERVRQHLSLDHRHH